MKRKKNFLIWAIEQVCMIKIVGTTTPFILSGKQVPWSPSTQAGYLSFQWSKRAGGKILRKNLVFWPTFFFLINFIRHTGPRVTMVTKGHQAHRQAISAFSGQNELGEKFIVFSGNGCCGVGVEWLILRLILMLLVKNGLIYTRTIVILDLLLWLKSFWC